MAETEDRPVFARGGVGALVETDPGEAETEAVAAVPRASPGLLHGSMGCPSEPQNQREGGRGKVPSGLRLGESGRSCKHLFSVSCVLPLPLSAQAGGQGLESHFICSSQVPRGFRPS